MKKNHFISQLRFCGIALLGVGALMLSSCADDGYNDDERWSSTVKNTQLSSPDAANIKVTASADGKRQTISWPVVNGAGGYKVTIYVQDGVDTLAKDSVIDGCAITVARVENTYYEMAIHALGNVKNNNTSSLEPTVMNWNTFLPADAIAPNEDKFDLYEWMQVDSMKTLIETPKDGSLVIDLQPNVTYRLSNIIDLGYNKVVLRTLSKDGRATIVYDNGASIRFGGGFVLNNININGLATTDPILGLSETPNEAILGTGSYYIINDPVTIQNCYIYNVQRQLVHDTKKKYCIHNFTIDNSVVNFTTDAGMSGGSYIQIYDGGGFINLFNLTNSTFWNSTNETLGELKHAKYFVRYNNSGRCTRAGFDHDETNISNCTFYNIAKTGQVANRAGLDGQKTSWFDVKNNIFVDCGSGQVPRRFVGRVGDVEKVIFNNNTYWFDGKAENCDPNADGNNTQYDNGYQLQSDPAFEDAANGDFTPTGAEQVALKTGAPRWFE